MIGGFFEMNRIMTVGFFLTCYLLCMVVGFILAFCFDVIFSLIDFIRRKYRVLCFSRYCDKAIDGFSGYAKESGISDLAVQYVKQACVYYDRTHKKHGYVQEETPRP